MPHYHAHSRKMNRRSRGHKHGTRKVYNKYQLQKMKNPDHGVKHFLDKNIKYRIFTMKQPTTESIHAAIPAAWLLINSSIESALSLCENTEQMKLMIYSIYLILKTTFKFKNSPEEDELLQEFKQEWPGLALKPVVKEEKTPEEKKIFSYINTVLYSNIPTKFAISVDMFTNMSPKNSMHSGGGGFVSKAVALTALGTAAASTPVHTSGIAPYHSHTFSLTPSPSPSPISTYSVSPTQFNFSKINALARNIRLQDSLHPSWLESINRHLTPYLGPMSTVIRQEHFDTNVLERISNAFKQFKQSLISSPGLANFIEKIYLEAVLTHFTLNNLTPVVVEGKDVKRFIEDNKLDTKVYNISKPADTNDLVNKISSGKAILRQVSFLTESKTIAADIKDLIYSFASGEGQSANVQNRIIRVKLFIEDNNEYKLVIVNIDDIELLRVLSIAYSIRPIIGDDTQVYLRTFLNSEQSRSLSFFDIASLHSRRVTTTQTSVMSSLIDGIRSATAAQVALLYKEYGNKYIERMDIVLNAHISNKVVDGKALVSQETFKMTHNMKDAVVRSATTLFEGNIATFVQEPNAEEADRIITNIVTAFEEQKQDSSTIAAVKMAGNAIKQLIKDSSQAVENVYSFTKATGAAFADVVKILAFSLPGSALAIVIHGLLNPISMHATGTVYVGLNATVFTLYKIIMGSELSPMYPTAMSALIALLIRSGGNICKNLLDLYRSLKGKDAVHREKMEALRRDQEEKCEQARLRVRQQGSLMYTNAMRQADQRIVDACNQEAAAAAAAAPAAATPAAAAPATLPAPPTPAAEVIENAQGGSRKKRKNRR